MNILNLAPKQPIVSSPLASNGTASELSNTRPLPRSSPAVDPLDAENIYEELDQLTKQAILDKKDTELGYVTYQYSKESRLRSEERFPNEKRPPAPLPYLTRTNQSGNKLPRDYWTPTPPQKPPIEPRIPSKLTENTLEGTRHKVRKTRPEKSPLVTKASRDTVQQEKTNTHKSISTAPTTIGPLSRNSSIRFTIPLKVSSSTASAIPLYSLQRSEDFTSELQNITDIYTSGLDELSEGEDSLLFNLSPLPTQNTRLALCIGIVQSLYCR